MGLGHSSINLSGHVGGTNIIGGVEGGSKITINGKTLTLPSGPPVDVMLRDGRIFLDGKELDPEGEKLTGPVQITIQGNVTGNVEGAYSTLAISGNVTGNARAGSTLTCGAVGGDAKSGTTMTVQGDVKGRAHSGTNMHVRGGVKGGCTAGTSVTVGGHIEGDVVGHTTVTCCRGQRA